MTGDSRSLSEVHSSVDTTAKRSKWKRLFSFLGPAYLVSVGYMDPGNWATDIAGGSKYGYSLLWVLLMSNIMAMILQSHSARLGIVRGRDLAQANRETYPKPVNFILYLLAEVAIAAADLAEVLGMAIGIQLLTGMPLMWGVSITVLDTFLILYLQKLGMRKMEAFIVALVAIIFVCFMIQVFMAEPDAAEVVKGFVPTLKDNTALYIAIGIIGATVMPHNLYLHSALVQSRKIDRTESGLKQAIRFTNIDTVVALNFAFLVNAGILILAAAVFFKTGNSHVAEIKEAHQLLPGFLGNLAPMLFAIALIAAGQSSTVTGTLAGQIVMEGYLRLRINPMLRRLVTRLVAIVPALIALWIYGEKEVDALLVLSQVILSLQLGFAIIPLLHFVSDKKTMGKFAISTVSKIFSWLIAATLVYLNFRMLGNEFFGEWNLYTPASKVLIVAGLIFFGLLLLYITVYPSIANRRSKSIAMHDTLQQLELSHPPSFKRIAIALDFTPNDQKLIQYALAQGRSDTQYLLIHVVESASANLLGIDSRDFETLSDKKIIDDYTDQLTKAGYDVVGKLGFKKRVSELSRIINEEAADLLVIGAHGHTAMKDFLYGETVNAVRHKIKIPVFVVNL